MDDRYEIERFLIPGLPWKWRVKADKQCGPSFCTRAEAEKRRAELLRKVG